MSETKREYSDGYLAVTLIKIIAALCKVLALLCVGLGLLLSVSVLVQGKYGAAAISLGVFLVTGVALFVGGVLIQAFGEAVSAVLDTAVNTRTLLPDKPQIPAEPIYPAAAQVRPQISSRTIWVAASVAAVVVGVAAAAAWNEYEAQQYKRSWESLQMGR